MYIRITLLFCYVQLGHIFADIDSSKQCSSANSTANASTCGSYWSSSETCPSSAGCLNVLWTEFKPYSYMKDSKTKFKGIIPGIFEELIERCCETCWKLNLTVKVSRQSITTGKIPSYIDIVLPYSSSGEGTKVKDMNFVMFVENPSVVYITKKESASAIPRKLIGAIWNAWPVLIMALLLSVVSGVLLWFLEFWQNPEEFPRSFFKGAWEGFWWAFVSMTTVGYGDRAPRSILGRTFAIFWIMIGICICSIFTATLTTSLTTITLEKQKTLARAKVGAIRNSMEANAGVNSKAKVKNYNSTTDLWRALHNDAVEGVLLDSYFSATAEVSKYIEDNDFTISQTVEVDERSYGILVRDENLTRCLREEYREHMDENADDINELITDEIESESSENEAAARSDSIFNPTGDIFWPSFYACIGLVIVMLITGLIWEFFCMDKCYKRAITGSSVAVGMNATNLDQMEKEMIADIQKMFSTWRAQRDLEIGIAGPMEVQDVEQNGEQFGMKQWQQFPQQQPVSQQKL